MISFFMMMLGGARSFQYAPRSVVRSVAPLRSDLFGGVPENDDKFWNELTQNELKQRSAELAVGGKNRVAAQYVLMLTSKHPNEMVRDFYASTSPAAQVAVQDALTAVLGATADTSAWRTTGQRVAELCFRLQMTGYMLRNAEYVLAIRQVLDLSKATALDQVKQAFDKWDKNQDGYLSKEEVEGLFSEFEESARTTEVENFLKFFDSNEDGRVSFDEFVETMGFGGLEDVEQAAFSPPISGEIELVFQDRVQKIDAAEYVANLQAEAESLRAALASAKQGGASPEATAIAQAIQEQVTSLSTYVNDLDDRERKTLTNTLTPDAKQAVAQLVSYVLGGANGGKPVPADAGLELQRQVLEQLCLWQIVVGYRLREMEATGEAKKRLGK